MTNQEAKQKAIKEAYGEYWETVKKYVDENGNLFVIDYKNVIYDKKIVAFMRLPESYKL